MYTAERTRSTQKLPIACVDRPIKPRISATSTAMPVAADKKFCTPSPSIWLKIAERRLAAVALPIGIGREAYRGIEG